MGKHGYNPGDIGWCQINTSDADAAIGFYTKLFDWDQHDGPTPDYHVFGNGPEMLGGITGLPEGATTPHWIPYVTVSDVDATAEKVKSLGGTIVGEPQEIPDAGKYIIFADPQGVQTAAIQYVSKPDA